MRMSIALISFVHSQANPIEHKDQLADRLIAAVIPSNYLSSTAVQMCRLLVCAASMLCIRSIWPCPVCVSPDGLGVSYMNQNLRTPAFSTL